MIVQLAVQSVSIVPYCLIIHILQPRDVCLVPDSVSALIGVYVLLRPGEDLTIKHNCQVREVNDVLDHSPITFDHDMLIHDVPLGSDMNPPAILPSWNFRYAEHMSKNKVLLGLARMIMISLSLFSSYFVALDAE